MNPVAANMVKRPEEYVWSSYHSNAWGESSWLTQHDEYKRLGSSAKNRCQHYRQPVGDDRYKKMLEKKYGVKLGQARRGRPLVAGSG